MGGLARAPLDHAAPGGESLADVQARVLPRLAEWARLFRGTSVAIVAHSWVVRVSVCAALDLSLDRAARLEVPTGSITTIDWPANAPVGESAPVRPTLAGFVTEAPPRRSTAWFRGPHRTTSR